MTEKSDSEETGEKPKTYSVVGMGTTQTDIEQAVVPDKNAEHDAATVHRATTREGGVIVILRQSPRDDDQTDKTALRDSSTQGRLSRGTSLGRISNGTSQPSIEAITAQVVSTLENFDDPHERKTDLCFGSCCDVRLACICVCGIYLFFMSMLLLASLCGFRKFDHVGTWTFLENNETDDEGRKNTYFGVYDFQIGLGFFFGLLGLNGARIFNKYLVFVTGFWFCVDAILYMVSLNWFSAVFIGAYAYPHFALFLALKNGTLTRENYEETEKHCCCCMDDRQ
jgi:hypothetical protein